MEDGPRVQKSAREHATLGKRSSKKGFLVPLTAKRPETDDGNIESKSDSKQSTSRGFLPKAENGVTKEKKMKSVFQKPKSDAENSGDGKTNKKKNDSTKMDEELVSKNEKKENKQFAQVRQSGTGLTESKEKQNGKDVTFCGRPKASEKGKSRKSAETAAKPPRSLTENEYCDLFESVLQAVLMDSLDESQSVNSKGEVKSESDKENNEHSQLETLEMRHEELGAQNVARNSDFSGDVGDDSDDNRLEKGLPNADGDPEQQQMDEPGTRNDYMNDVNSVASEEVNDWNGRQSISSIQGENERTPTATPVPAVCFVKGDGKKTKKLNKLKPRQLYFPESLKKDSQKNKPKLQDASFQRQNEGKPIFMEGGSHISTGIVSKERNSSLTKVTGWELSPFAEETGQEETGTWVQCTIRSCKKWRYLVQIEDPILVPEKWECNMNSDKEHNSCELPEVNYDESDHIYTKFTIGSVVWAKLDGYPWWPAMVECDPDYDTYFELLTAASMVPTQYHVSFFDDQVTRAWVKASSMAPYIKGTEPKTGFSKRGHSYKKHVKDAMQNADKALELTLQERVAKYGFENRFSRKSRPRKQEPHGKSSENQKPKFAKKKVTQRKAHPKTMDPVEEIIAKAGSVSEEIEKTLKTLDSSSEEEDLGSVSLEDSEYIPLKTTSCERSSVIRCRQQQDKAEIYSRNLVSDVEVHEKRLNQASDSSDPQSPKAPASKMKSVKVKFDPEIFALEGDTPLEDEASLPGKVTEQENIEDDDNDDGNSGGDDDEHPNEVADKDSIHEIKPTLTRKRETDKKEKRIPENRVFEKVGVEKACNIQGNSKPIGSNKPDISSEIENDIEDEDDHDTFILDEGDNNNVKEIQRQIWKPGTEVDVSDDDDDGEDNSMEKRENPDPEGLVEEGMNEKPMQIERAVQLQNGSKSDDRSNSKIINRKVVKVGSNKNEDGSDNKSVKGHPAGKLEEKRHNSNEMSHKMESDATQKNAKKIKLDKLAKSSAPPTEQGKKQQNCLSRKKSGVTEDGGIDTATKNPHIKIRQCSASKTRNRNEANLSGAANRGENLECVDHHGIVVDDAADKHLKDTTDNHESISAQKGKMDKRKNTKPNEILPKQARNQKVMNSKNNSESVSSRKSDNDSELENDGEDEDNLVLEVGDSKVNEMKRHRSKKSDTDIDFGDDGDDNDNEKKEDPDPEEVMGHQDMNKKPIQNEGATKLKNDGKAYDGNKSNISKSKVMRVKSAKKNEDGSKDKLVRENSMGKIIDEMQYTKKRSYSSKADGPRKNAKKMKIDLDKLIKSNTSAAEQGQKLSKARSKKRNRLPKDDEVETAVGDKCNGENDYTVGEISAENMQKSTHKSAKSTGQMMQESSKTKSDQQSHLQKHEGTKYDSDKENVDPHADTQDIAVSEHSTDSEKEETFITPEIAEGKKKKRLFLCKTNSKKQRICAGKDSQGSCSKTESSAAYVEEDSDMLGNNRDNCKRKSIVKTEVSTCERDLEGKWKVAPKIHKTPKKLKNKREMKKKCSFSTPTTKLAADPDRPDASDREVPVKRSDKAVTDKTEACAKPKLDADQHVPDLKDEILSNIDSESEVNLDTNSETKQPVRETKRAQNSIVDDEEEELDLKFSPLKVAITVPTRILSGDESSDDNYSDDHVLDLDIQDGEKVVVEKVGGGQEILGRFGGGCYEHGSDSDPLELIED